MAVMDVATDRGPPFLADHASQTPGAVELLEKGEISQRALAYQEQTEDTKSL